jgi:hypothetical protein
VEYPFDVDAAASRRRTNLPILFFFFFVIVILEDVWLDTFLFPKMKIVDSTKAIRKK